MDAVADIDKLVGKRGRSSLLTEVAQREIKIRQQHNAISWRDGSSRRACLGA